MWRVFGLVWVIMAGGAAAQHVTPGTMCSTGLFGHVGCIRPQHFVHDTCQAIASQSRQHGLDPGFFARLIWQESRFDPNALSHADARGIAQFIDSTAALRGLRDPLNPAQALEYSAQYLGELTRRYGNHGLAAVAYNGGERRANGLVAGTGGLARETVNYVQIITGLTAETWRDAPPEAHDFRLSATRPFAAACEDMAQGRAFTRFKKPEPSLPAWGVQLSFGTSPDAAATKYAAATRACAAGVRGEKVDYVHVRNRVSGRKGFYMARIGRDARDAADRLCNALRRQGCTCAVYRND